MIATPHTVYSDLLFYLACQVVMLRIVVLVEWLIVNMSQEHMVPGLWFPDDNNLFHIDYFSFVYW